MRIYYTIMKWSLRHWIEDMEQWAGGGDLINLFSAF